MADETLRQRNVVVEEKSANGAARKPVSRSSEDKGEDSLSKLDIFRIIAGLLLLNCLLSYFITNDSVLWGWRPWFIQPKAVGSWMKGPLLLTDDELAKYDGSNPDLPLYLALNGTIYDVSAGRRFYGPGSSYHAFAGKDASRGWITGCFREDGSPDLRGAEWTYVPLDVPGFDEKATGPQKSYREQELRKANKRVHEAIEGWQNMFSGKTGREYFEVGKIKREKGWLEKLPLRELCANAHAKRPQSQGDKVNDPGSAFRGN